MGKFSVVGNAANRGLNSTLRSILSKAAEQSNYNVEAYSGLRPGDKRYHGQNAAVDVRLVDPKTNKAVPNYQSADSFRAYEQFAQAAKMAQQQVAPEEGGLRWGGYFSGAPGVYGAADLMHFDTDPKKIGMAGGSWANGLTNAQQRLYPGSTSVGLGPLGTKASVGWDTDTVGAPGPGKPGELGTPVAEGPAPQMSASDRMWEGMKSILGAPVTQAMRAGNIAIGGVESLSNLAAKVATQSAQQQPQNPVSNSEPAQAMHEAINQQYGGPQAAADAAKAQGINYSPGAVTSQSLAPASSSMPDFDSSFSAAASTMKQGLPQQSFSQPARPVSATPASARTAPDVGVSSMGLQPTDLSTANVPSMAANAAPSMADLEAATLSKQIAEAGVGPAPGAITNAKPGELGYTAPAPAPPAAKPARPAPAPVQIAQARPVPKITPPRPVTIPAPAVVQQAPRAAPAPTLASLGQVNNARSVAAGYDPGSAQGIAASGTGLLGALGLIGQAAQQQAPQQQNISAPGGLLSSLASGIKSLFGGSQSAGLDGTPAYDGSLGSYAGKSWSSTPNSVGGRNYGYGDGADSSGASHGANTGTAGLY